MTGQTAARAELQIDDREELIFFLTEAAELEHLLCCSYLYAAFSLKTHQSEGVTASQLEDINRWREQIKGIAVQEMGHLARVSNLLTALGGAPHFGRPNFPQQGKYYPAHLPLSLTPLTVQTLDRFIDLEHPEGPAQGPAPHAEGAPPADGAPVPEPQTYASVGALYAGIERGLRLLVERLGEAGVFIGPLAAQADAHEVPLDGVGAIHDLDSALEAIHQIVDEGEGQPGNRSDTHYDRFMQIRAEFQELLAADPAFEPARPCLSNPCTRPPSDATGVNLVKHPVTQDVMELFNAGYALMVQLLARFFGRGEESPTERATLMEAAVTLMAEVLTPLGETLTRQPSFNGGDTLTAGPSFEFHRAIQALPHRTTAWIRFQERARALADHADRLSGSAGPDVPLPAVSQPLQRLADQLVLSPPSQM
jgi:hypothetical protein